MASEVGKEMVMVHKWVVLVVVGVIGAASSAVGILVKPGKCHGRASSTMYFVSFQELELLRISVPRGAGELPRAKHLCRKWRSVREKGSTDMTIN